MIYLDLTSSHSLAAANAHFYKEPTNERYIDRTISCHDFIYMIDGGWSFVEDGIEYTLKKDDVLLLAAGRHHFTKYPCLPETKTFCIHVSCEPGDNNESKTSTCFQTLINVENAPTVKQYFDNIVSAYWAENPYKEQKLSSLVNLLLVSLYEENVMQASKSKNLAQKAIDLLANNPHKRFKTSEVADYFFVCSKTLDNAMRKSVGVPFYTYEKNQKLEMVATQLKMEPDAKLHDLAISFGFHDEFHLSKAFKKKMGMSPQEYRKGV